MRIVLSLLFLSLFSVPAQAQSATGAPATGIYALDATALNDAPPFSSYSGNLTLVVLFQPGCAWCALQFQSMEELKRDRAPWLQMAAVSRNGSIPALLRELDHYQTNIPAYQSSNELLRALRNTPGTPCLYLVGPDGRLAQTACGRLTTDQLVGFLTGR